MMMDQDSISTATPSTAALDAIRADYRWTPACQRGFLEELACTGSVTRACLHVGKSPRSAYMLRFRHDGAALALGWDAAILNARVVVADMLMERALNGYEEITVKHEDGRRVRQKVDNRLGMNLLVRLDKMSEGQAMRNSVQAHIQIISQDFTAYLDLIERGGTGAQAALFCSARSVGDDHVAMDEEYVIGCELDRMEADEDRALYQAQCIPDMLDEAPEVAAARLSIWYDDHNQEWKTNFPAPITADDDYGEDLEEVSVFGDSDYERNLTQAETKAHLAALAELRKPWHTAAAAVRDAWLTPIAEAA
jgi:hypothetical protein